MSAFVSIPDEKAPAYFGISRPYPLPTKMQAIHIVGGHFKELPRESMYKFLDVCLFSNDPNNVHILELLEQGQEVPADDLLLRLKCHLDKISMRVLERVHLG